MKVTLTKYVLGFAFDDTGERVVLIRKKRPLWQAGRLNGVGGHIDGIECSYRALVREFKEKTGVETEDWNSFGKIYGADWECWLYWLSDSKIVGAVKTVTDEPIEVHLVKALQNSKELISNLHWLIPAALDHKRGGGRIDFRVRYSS